MSLCHRNTKCDVDDVKSVAFSQQFCRPVSEYRFFPLLRFVHNSKCFVLFCYVKHNYRDSTHAKHLYYCELIMEGGHFCKKGVLHPLFDG